MYVGLCIYYLCILGFTVFSLCLIASAVGHQAEADGSVRPCEECGHAPH